jgi:dTDP-glucose 4,6-dehydratase
VNLLVTGSAGFIGSAFVRMLLGKPLSHFKGLPKISDADRIVSLDLLTYAGTLENLKPIESDSRHQFVKGDIADPKLVRDLVREYRIDTIVNFAAESHVDRSIAGAGPFVHTNVLGTVNLLDITRENNLRFVQVSTDEVYGSLGETGTFVETTPLAPNSPYSASKAAADCFVRSYHETHKIWCVTTRCSNNYGPYQFPEKFLPLSITNLMRNKKIPLYGTGKNIRDWLHVEDHCEGIWLALTKGKSGEIYNFGGFGEKKNIDVAYEVLAAFSRKPDEGLDFVADRKGHDWRYSMDSTKAQTELGWKPRWSFEDGLKSTLDWYKSNTQWWESKIPRR